MYVVMICLLSFFLYHHWKSLIIIFWLLILCLSYLRFSTRNGNVISSRTHTLTRLSLSLPTLPLNYTRHNSYSASSDPLGAGPKPPMDNSLDNASDLTQHSWISWCRALGFEWRFRSSEITIVLMLIQLLRSLMVLRGRIHWTRRFVGILRKTSHWHGSTSVAQPVSYGCIQVIITIIMASHAHCIKFLS